MKLQLNKRNRKGFTLIELMVVITILAALAAVGYGPIMDHLGDGDRQAAKDHMTNIHKALVNFRSANNTFPCDATGRKIEKKWKAANTDLGPLTGDDANCYFRQLFDKDAPEEKTFAAKCGNYVEGDGVVANRKCLEPGENAFAYVVKDDGKNGHGSVSDSNSAVPLVLCCVAPSQTPYKGDQVKFDLNGFRSHAFVLTVGGSVEDIRDKQYGWKNDDEDESEPAKPIFPQTKSGTDTGSNYFVLPPAQQ